MPTSPTLVATVATMVRNSAGSWETIEVEVLPLPIDLSSVSVSASDIGGEPGQAVRIEVYGADGGVVDSIETVSV